MIPSRSSIFTSIFIKLTLQTVKQRGTSFFLTNFGYSVLAIADLKDALVAEVQAGSFVAVCEGVNNEVLGPDWPDINEDEVRPIRYEPGGVHPVGQMQVNRSGQLRPAK